MNQTIILPAEWYPQSAIQLTWPHLDSDWNYMLPEVTNCFIDLASEILKHQTLLIVCKNKDTVRFSLKGAEDNFDNLVLVELPSNDTWNRDHGGISVFVDGKPHFYDFIFNGWGMKYAANKDNQINRRLFEKRVFDSSVKYVNKKDFVLEGGGIESDGKGTLLTTSECLLSPNRNASLTRNEIETYLKKSFGLNRVLWLDHGYLAGDDTDSHVDTLARFCDEHTIAYVKCEDENDEHYDALRKMEEQLQAFVDFEGNAYKLVALPMAKAVLNEDNDRLPATYANFLIMNEVVLMPTYKNQELDDLAKSKLQAAFPTRQIVGIDCSPLIRQHGSLHCVTMQFPKGYLVSL